MMHPGVCCIFPGMLIAITDACVASFSHNLGFSRRSFCGMSTAYRCAASRREMRVAFIRAGISFWRLFVHADRLLGNLSPVMGRR